MAARAGWTPADLARAFLDGGARCLQLRAKELPSGRFLDLCDLVVGAASAYGALVIVNDRVDLALLSGASGAHVGQDDLAPSAVRAILGPQALVGRSTHTLAQVRLASAEPVSYVAIGPVFGTRTKDTGYDAVGLEVVSAAVRDARGLPVVAIGGITLETAPLLLAAGASGVAVISDLLAGANPSVRTAQYIRALSPPTPSGER